MANLLTNNGFELPSNSSEDIPSSWKMNDPDDHGDLWGSAVRMKWRSRSGDCAAAIRGKWAGAGDYGGFWQENAGKGGKTYTFSAWFWADPEWKAQTQEIKIEFLNEARNEVLATVKEPISAMGEIWTQKSVTGKAPEGTAWVRANINVSGAGDAGALQLDDAELMEAKP